ncbi:MAG TPA: baseplate J/gp47 family protein, partial [Roseomonas sp.]
PGWVETSEADLDQVLIDLFAAAADELSDMQDRVMNEAWLATARNRVSLTRHARLVDYHVHQGNQASTWLALLLDEATTPFSLAGELLAWAGHPEAPETRIYFATRETALPAEDRTLLDPLLNTLHLHTWSGSRPALRAGTVSADLVSARPGAGQAGAERIRDLVNTGRLARLLIEEKLDPYSGREPGRDPAKRQLLTLLPNAEALRDPLTDTWITRVAWRAEDALAADTAFTIRCMDGAVHHVSAFHGNLLRVYHGLPVTAHFHEPGEQLPPDGSAEAHRHLTRIRRGGVERAALCHLPYAPCAYLPTPPDGETPPRSTLRVTVTLDGNSDRWDEVTSLVHSDDGAEDGDHFVLETDELGRSALRFGNGTNGRRLPDGATVTCEYQVGGGTEGHVGAGMVTGFADPAGDIAALWNPFDVTDGRDPEPVQRVLRQAPEAYRVRQLRAITPADYVRRAEEVPGVARAAARYAWTGSWRTVRVAIDPAGTTELSPELRDAVTAHLEAVRLIGEDLELRSPRFVPATVMLGLCLRPDVWPEDIRAVIEAELSDGLTPDGRPGLFHPDRWSFGQALHASQIAGRVQAIPGVEHITHLGLRRYDAATPGMPEADMLEIAPDEIILVRNDPDHMERGGIVLTLSGGRQ